MMRRVAIISAGVILILGIFLTVETSRVQFGGFAGSASYAAEKELNDGDSTCDEGESGCNDMQIHGSPKGQVVVIGGAYRGHPTDMQVHQPSNQVVRSEISSLQSDSGNPGR